MSIQDKNIATQCVQGVYSPKNAEPRVAPIVQSTTYEYDKWNTKVNSKFVTLSFGYSFGF